MGEPTGWRTVPRGNGKPVVALNGFGLRVPWMRSETTGTPAMNRASQCTGMEILAAQLSERGRTSWFSAREPAHAMLNIAIWRGDAALPFEPPACRAAAGAAGGRGAPPPEPRCRCAHG